MIKQVIAAKLQNQKIKIIVKVICSFFLALSLFIILKPASEFTDNAYIKADIVVLRPKVSGNIVKSISNDNQELKAGQLIAKIDDRDYHLKANQAQEKLNEAKAHLESILHQVEIKSYETKNAVYALEAAKIAFEASANNLKRAQVLFKESAVSATDFEAIKADYKFKESVLVKAQSQYKTALHNQDLVELDKNQAESAMKAADAALKLANLDVEQTEIRAPTDGMVSKRNLQIGQLVSPNISLGYFVQSNVWVIANFKESQIGKMKKSQEVIITVDSLPGKKFYGRVDSISPATGAEFSILPPENGTGNFTKIVQRVPVKIMFNEGQDLKLLKSGLSCEVKVYL